MKYEPLEGRVTGHEQRAMSAGLILLFATTCGLMVAGNYFAQPLVRLIGAELGLPLQSAGLIVSLTQVGYCGGLLLLAPLGDFIENRKLVLTMLAIYIVAVSFAAWAPNAGAFLTASLALGATSTIIQILMTIAARMTPLEHRGAVVGTITSGLLLGIVLSRPLASLVTDYFGWHVLFAGSAVAAMMLAVMLSRNLPAYQPDTQIGYPALLRSLWTLLRDTPVLRQRAFSHATLFAGFSLFWTAVPMLLAQRYNMSQSGIALFALAGAGGVLVAPLAGRAADRGWTRPALLGAALTVGLSFAATGFGGPLWLLVIAGIVLDAGVQVSLVVSQRVVFSLDAENRARLNSLFIGIFFMGGAIGSAMAGALFAHGWVAVAMAGALLPVPALVIFFRSRLG